MINIFFVIDTQFYGKQYLLEYPFTENTFHYIQNKYSNSKKESQSKGFNANQTSSYTKETFLQDELLQLFLIEQKKRGQFTFDIMIEDLQYISYPTWVDQNKYFKAKKGEEEVPEEEKVQPTTAEAIKEEGDKYIRLEMFNIVFVLNKTEILGSKNKPNFIQNLYINLETYSRFLLFEEYRKHYLGLDFMHLIKFYDKFFEKENQDCAYKKFIESFPMKSNIYKHIESLYNGIKKLDIARVTLNNIDFKYFMDIKLFSDFSIKPYNSIVLTKPKRIKEFFQYSADINPMLLVFLEKMTPFKSILDVSLENHININMLLNFVNQLEAWGLAKKSIKIQNHSVFQVNSSMTIIEPKVDTLFSPLDLFTVLNQFSVLKPETTIEEIYITKFKKTIDNEKFLKGIIWFLEKEYLVQCVQIISVKLPFKHYYDFEKEALSKFRSLIKRNEKLELMVEDNNVNKILDKVYSSNNKDLNNDNNEDNSSLYYFEDFINAIKDTDEYSILRNITSLLYKKYSVEEISFYSGYKVHKIIEAIKKYPYVFDTFVIPLNEDDNNSNE